MQEDDDEEDEDVISEPEPMYAYTLTKSICALFVLSVCVVVDGWSRKRRVRPARSDTDSLQLQISFFSCKSDSTLTKSICALFALC